MTTIKVTDELRDRLKEQAAHEGLTLGAHLARLADADDRRRRLKSLKIAIEATSSCDWATSSTYEMRRSASALVVEMELHDVTTL